MTATATQPERGVPSEAPSRIVSLVPSLTEACFELGLGPRVVAVTDWCVHPAEAVARLPKLGGTKDPDVDRVAALAPDLVIANHEENTRRTVDALERRGLRVWVTYPRTVAEGVEVLRQLATLARRCQLALEAARRGAAVLAAVESAYEHAKRTMPSEPVRVFCPIWRDPWMSVGSDTYAGDLLGLCGGENVFGDRGDRRYPTLSLDELVAARPEVVLLPDEPYAFGPHDVDELARLDLPAARSGRIHRIDGTWVSWYGPRIALAIASLRSLLANTPC